MHWTIGGILVMLVVFAAGAYVAKSYPGSIPYIT